MTRFLGVIRLLSVFLAGVGGVAQAHAAPFRTISFEGSGLSITGDPFGALGIETVDTITGSFTYDLLASQLSGPTPSGSDSTAASTASWSYLSFEVQLGSFLLSGTGSGTILVQDGIGDSVFDTVRVSSGPGAELVSGIFLLGMELLLRSAGTTNAFDGTAVPSLAALSSLTNVDYFLFDVTPTGATANRVVYNNLVFSESISAVPLPAGLPLLFGALAGLGAFGWRQGRTRSVSRTDTDRQDMANSHV